MDMEMEMEMEMEAGQETMEGGIPTPSSSPPSSSEACQSSEERRTSIEDGDGDGDKGIEPESEPEQGKKRGDDLGPIPIVDCKDEAHPRIVEFARFEGVIIRALKEGETVYVRTGDLCSAVGLKNPSSVRIDRVKFRMANRIVNFSTLEGALSMLSLCCDRERAGKVSSLLKGSDFDRCPAAKRKAKRKTGPTKRCKAPEDERESGEVGTRRGKDERKTRGGKSKDTGRKKGKTSEKVKGDRDGARDERRAERNKDGEAPNKRAGKRKREPEPERGEMEQASRDRDRKKDRKIRKLEAEQEIRRIRLESLDKELSAYKESLSLLKLALMERGVTK